MLLPTMKDDPKITDLQELVRTRRVVALVGAGVSIAASGGAPTASWKGLLLDGIARCQRWAGASADWCERQRQQVERGDAEEMASTADLISRRLGGPDGGEFRRWLREAVGQLPMVHDAVPRTIAALGVPIATTNYDDLLATASDAPPVCWDEDHHVEQVLQGRESGVLHLHGHWRRPASVVLGMSSYRDVVAHPHASAVRSAIRAMNSVLFIGCGETTNDPNIGAWLRWWEMAFAGTESRSYRLERDDRVAEVAQQHSPGQRIVVLGYGTRHEDLPAFLRRLSGLAPNVANAAGAPATAFAEATDDGLRPTLWPQADAVLVGISRTGKTTLARHLSQDGLRVATVPVAADLRPPAGLSGLDPRRVFALVCEPGLVARRRQAWARQDATGALVTYASIERVVADTDAAARLFAAHPKWTPLDGTHKAIEQLAAAVKLRLGTIQR